MPKARPWTGPVLLGLGLAASACSSGTPVELVRLTHNEQRAIVASADAKQSSGTRSDIHTACEIQVLGATKASAMTLDAYLIVLCEAGARSSPCAQDSGFQTAATATVRSGTVRSLALDPGEDQAYVDWIHTRMPSALWSAATNADGTRLEKRADSALKCESERAPAMR